VGERGLTYQKKGEYGDVIHVANDRTRKCGKRILQRGPTWKWREGQWNNGSYNKTRRFTRRMKYPFRREKMGQANSVGQNKGKVKRNWKRQATSLMKPICRTWKGNALIYTGKGTIKV